MPDSPEVEQNFTAPVYGVVGKVAGNQIIYASPQKQDLAEAAAEIQRLLKQLEETNPTATEKQKEAYINAAVSTPVRKRLLGAVKSGGKAALEEFLDNPYLNVTIALIEGWKTADIGMGYEPILLLMWAKETFNNGRRIKNSVVGWVTNPSYNEGKGGIRQWKKNQRLSKTSTQPMALLELYRATRISILLQLLKLRNQQNYPII